MESKLCLGPNCLIFMVILKDGGVGGLILNMKNPFIKLMGRSLHTLDIPAIWWGGGVVESLPKYQAWIFPYQRKLNMKKISNRQNTS